MPHIITSQRSSRLFCPYRAIGSISDGAAFAINRLGDATFVTTTVGNSFQVFESEKLRLSIVAPPLIKGGRVVAIAAQGSRTFIATERQIQVSRVDHITTMDRPSSSLLLPHHPPSFPIIILPPCRSGIV